MNTIKIAVCDDEQYIRSYLISLIQKQNYETEITEYASAVAYLSDTAEYDLLFLDIEMNNSCPEHTSVPDGQAIFSMENAALHGEQASSSTENAALHGERASFSTEYAALYGKRVSSSTENAALHGEQADSDTGNRINGMELARRIRAAEGRPQPLIIFVTGYESYVYDAFDVDAFQYLLKPIDEQKFAAVFRRAAERIIASEQQQQRKLVIQYAGTSRVLPLSDIYYMESQGHKIVLHLKDTTLEYYARLGELEQALQGQFCRIHKGFLVNLAYVEGYSRAEVTLANGDKLNLSKYKYDDFVKAHLRFIRSSA